MTRRASRGPSQDVRRPQGCVLGVLCSLWPWRPSQLTLRGLSFPTPIRVPRKLAAVSWPERLGGPAAWPPGRARVPEWCLRVSNLQPFPTSTAATMQASLSHSSGGLGVLWEEACGAKPCS